MEIDLSSNHLSGPIPQELGQLQNLVSLRVENNNLLGDILSLMSCFSLAFLFIGNPALCGYWISSPCHASHRSERVSISKAAILGIAPGSLVILLMILVATCRPHNPTPILEGSPNKLVNYSSPKLVILHVNMALHAYMKTS